MFEEKMTVSVSAAILRPAVCVNDVVNRADMRGESITYIMSQLLLLTGEERTSMYSTQRNANSKRKEKVLLYKYRPKKACK